MNPALLAAVIEQETKFDANARSSAGAIGLMQLQPATAKGIAVHTGGTSSSSPISTIPRSTCATARGISATCSKKYHDERLALAAYNAGQANVDSGARKARTSSSPRRGPTSTGSSG